MITTAESAGCELRKFKSVQIRITHEFIEDFIPKLEKIIFFIVMCKGRFTQGIASCQHNG